jgi:hypothetical protein
MRCQSCNHDCVVCTCVSRMAMLLQSYHSAYLECKMPRYMCCHSAYLECKMPRYMCCHSVAMLLHAPGSAAIRICTKYLASAVSTGQAGTCTALHSPAQPCIAWAADDKSLLLLLLQLHLPPVSMYMVYYHSLLTSSFGPHHE